MAAGGAALSAGAGAVASAASALFNTVSGTGDGAASGAPSGGPRPHHSTSQPGPSRLRELDSSSILDLDKKLKF